MPLWYAGFMPELRDFPAGIWSTYTLWQFSSEIKRQYAIPGVKPDIDINVYNGTVQQLKAAWPFTRKERIRD
jgi:lysozyme